MLEAPQSMLCSSFLLGRLACLVLPLWICLRHEHPFQQLVQIFHGCFQRCAPLRHRLIEDHLLEKSPMSTTILVNCISQVSFKPCLLWGDLGERWPGKAWSKQTRTSLYHNISNIMELICTTQPQSSLKTAFYDLYPAIFLVYVVYQCKCVHEKDNVNPTAWLS